jgi:predicted P-loop ATPase
MTEFFDYAERYGLALFPMPYGSKAPHGIIGSFAHDWSRSPKQWAAWRAAHKCNFGIVAGPSRIIAVDVDVAEVGPERAWSVWTEWCTSNALPVYQAHTATARGGWHILFSCPPDLHIDTLRQVPLVGPIEGVSKKAIIELRVKNGFVVAPESFYNGNAKSEASGAYKLISDAAPHPAPAALVAACTRAKPKNDAVARAGTADAGDVEKVLTWMAQNGDFASYQQWCEAGMILRSEFGDDPGFVLWQLTNDGTCSADAEAAKWQSFAADPRSDGVSIGTLRHNANKAGCPHGIRKSTAAMFGGVALAAAGAGMPATVLGATNGGMPMLGGQIVVAEMGRPILDRFLEMSIRDAPPAELHMPSDHPLHEPLSFAIGTILARSRVDDAVFDVLAVLAAAHETTFEIVREKLNLKNSGSLSAACARFNARCEFELKTQGGWITNPKTGYPEQARPANFHRLLRILNCQVRRNDWLERDEIRGGYDWPDWTFINDNVVARLLTEARNHAFQPSKDFVWDTITTFAGDNKVDPAIDRLKTLEIGWDGISRTNDWLHHAVGAPADLYHQMVGQRVLGSLVRRIREPGCKIDEMLVLMGPQGQSKSTMVKLLSPIESGFADGVKLGEDSKELILLLAGRSVCEISEMDTRTPKNIETVKAMLVKTSDLGRTAYARAVSDRLRRNIFVGTSNSNEPLNDITGGRRFLPVHCQRVDLLWLQANIDMLLGEFCHLHARGERFELPESVWSLLGKHQEKARHQTDEEIQMREWFGETPMTKAAYITGADLAQLASDAGWSKENRTRSAVMRALKFEDCRPYIGGKQVRVWWRGPKSEAAVRYGATRTTNFQPQVSITTPAAQPIAELPPLPY